MQSNETRFAMFAFDRSAFAVLAPLALLALAAAASNYTSEPRPEQASERPERLRDAQQQESMVARNHAAPTRH